MERSKVGNILSVAWISICVSAVCADYVVFVWTHSYMNPGSLLANGECCDLNVTKGDGSCAVPGCDIYFYYCIRNDLQQSRCRGSSIVYNVERLVFPEPTSFAGLPNPLPLSGLTRQWNGIHFHLEVHEADSGVSSGVVGLVDYDIATPIGQESKRLTFNYSQPERSSIELSFMVVCAENYYGRDCSQFCNASSCPCEPGFYGEFCQERNDCLGVSCNGNGQCVDGMDTYSCECVAGFTGEDCEVDIDECEMMNVNCSGRGVCVDEVNNYSCSCDSGFTRSACGKNLADVADQDTNRGEARLRLAGGVVGGLLAGGLILVAVLASLIVILVCLRKAGSGGLKRATKSGHESGQYMYALNNQMIVRGDKRSPTHCTKESTYVNVRNKYEDLEHNFENPIYNTNGKADDNMYSAIGSVPNHKATVTETLEYRFDNPIYGNENEAQYDSPLELNTAGIPCESGEKVLAQTSMDSMEHRVSKSIAPYETVSL